MREWAELFDEPRPLAVFKFCPAYIELLASFQACTP